ncbi:MAG TPA: VOC family protein [Conexivisphaerales archaeon]|nr:VOC family protein [Conexivisphaerales archaeon]
MPTALNPYLNFNGNAAQAMKFYQSVLGGKLDMQTFAEAKMARTPAENDLIVHATLKTDDLSFFASDTQPSMPAKFGSNVNMSLTGNDVSKLTAIFNGLAKDGNVTMPLAKQYWGDTFGMLTDKFGVNWMVNIFSGQSQGMM